MYINKGKACSAVHVSVYNDWTSSLKEGQSEPGGSSDMQFLTPPLG